MNRTSFIEHKKFYKKTSIFFAYLYYQWSWVILKKLPWLVHIFPFKSRGRQTSIHVCDLGSALLPEHPVQVYGKISKIGR